MMNFPFVFDEDKVDELSENLFQVFVPTFTEEFGPWSNGYTPYLLAVCWHTGSIREYDIDNSIVNECDIGLKVID